MGQCLKISEGTFFKKNNTKLQPVPLSMPSEALSVRFLVIDSASCGIDGGTGCNFIFFA